MDTETGSALDELEKDTRNWVASLGSKATTLSEIAKTKDPVVSSIWVTLIYIQIKGFTKTTPL
jgi:hypothetical protein